MTKSLYERLGGYDAISAFVTDYIRRIRSDPRFDRFGGGRGSDSRERSLQLNIDYMCKITGSSHYYMGRSMKEAHAGLGITKAEWEANLKHMAEALDEYKVPPKERREVLGLVGRMKKDFVEK